MHPIPDPHPPVKKPMLILAALFLSAFASILSVVTKPKPASHQIAQTPVADQQTPTPEVLGVEDIAIYVTPASGYGYGRYSLISLANTAAPDIKIGANKSGTVFLKLYRISPDQMLEFFVHDQDNNQLKPQLDTSQLTEVANFFQTVSKGYSAENQISLPLDESGIWYLTATLEDATRTSVIIRSKTGVVTREGNNELIFWAQDFNTHHSAPAGNIFIYDLDNRVQQLTQTTLNGQGLGTTSISNQADIALLDNDGDYAVIPLNLSYLNYSYGGYERFGPQGNNFKYFTFTDRPIYKPGDTIKFKSIIRGDDDARYFLPGGQAKVTINAGYGDENIIFDKTYPVASNGTINGEFTLPESAKTGTYYTLKVQHLEENRRDYWYSSGSTGFQVENYRKPEYFLTVDTADAEFVGDQTAKVQVKGEYFSGQALTGVEVSYNITSAQYYQQDRLSNYQRYQSNYWRYSYAHDSFDKGTVTLDENGEATIEFQTKPNPQIHDLRVYTISASYIDSTGNPVEDSGNVLVYPAGFSIFRTDSYRSYSPGDSITLPLKLLPVKGASVGNINLETQTTHTTWIKKYLPDQKYPHYEQVTTELSPTTLTTNQNGEASFTFTADSSGSYNIKVIGTDSQGQQVEKNFYFWVYSHNQPSYSGSTQELLAITQDKDLYTHTDTASLFIESEIPDSDVLLSLNRARVNRYQVVRLSGKSATVDLPLEESDMPNIYAVVNSFDQDSIHSTSTNLKVSTDPKRLLVTTKSNKDVYSPGEDISVTIKTTDYDNNPVSANVTFWAVDKSLFQLARNSLGEIFDFFWRERYNQTDSSHSLAGIYSNPAEQGGGCFTSDTQVLMADKSLKNIDQIKPGDLILTKPSPQSQDLVKAKVKDIATHTVPGYLIINTHLKVTPEHKLWLNHTWQAAVNAQIGDQLVNSSGQSETITSIEWQAGKTEVYNLIIQDYHTYFANGIWVHNDKADITREVFKDTAYWNPDIQTNSNGEATINFKLPDNLTTWVFSAVGANGDTQVGQTETEIKVSKSIVVRPVVPNLLRIGDTIHLSTLVHNFTDQTQTLAVSLDFPDGEIQSQNTQTITLEPKAFEEIFWQAAPQTQNPESKLTFSAYVPDIEEDIGDIVVQTIPVEEFGYWYKHTQVATDDHQFDTTLDPSINLDKSRASLTLSASIVGSIPDAMRYLVGYPYGCTEQTTSRFVPTVITKLYPNLYPSILEDPDIDLYLAKGIELLRKHQQSDGGWTWWGRGDSDYFVSAYVLEYLLLAQQQGADVPYQMIEQARNFFTNAYNGIQDKSTDNPTIASNLVEISYALSLLGDTSIKPITNFQHLKPDTLALAALTNLKLGINNTTQNGIEELISAHKLQGDQVYWEAGNSTRFGSIHTSTALAIRPLLEYGGHQELISQAIRYLVRTKTNRYWSNTFATAQIIRSASQYSDLLEDSPNYSYSVNLNNSVLKTGQVTDAKAQIAQIDLPIADFKPDSLLSVTKDAGDGQLYSTLFIEEFLNDPNASAKSNGISLTREYQNQKGEGYNIAVGDTVIVKLTVDGLSREDNFLVIDDQLPSGLIPINLNLDNERLTQANQGGDTYNRHHVEYRLDGVNISTYYIRTGQTTFTYKARAINQGQFQAPPAYTSLMYSPEIFALSDASSLTVDGESKAPTITKQILEPKDNKQKATLIIIGLFIVSLGGILVASQIIRRNKKKQKSNQLPD